jgi:Flp pilus assembly CpaE family ATPase
MMRADDLGRKDRGDPSASALDGGFAGSARSTKTVSVEATPDFGVQGLPDAAEKERLSVALIGPDERRRRLLATAITEPQLAKVREFRSYPKGAENLKWLLAQAFDVVILDLDDDQDAALDLVQQIASDDAATAMVYSERIDQKLAVRIMRAGAREYILLPLEEGIVAEALTRVSNSPRLKVRSSEKPKALGNLHVFLGAKGGAGVTTATCNLAVALARLSDTKPLLIDLNLPIGDAALGLGVTGEFSTEDAILSIDRLDGSLLEKLLVKHSSGLMVLPAPSKISNVEASSDAVDKLIAVARSEFANVIVDLGSKVDAPAAGVIKNATSVYLVTQTSVSDLRNSNRLISQYFTESTPKLEVVLNRFEPRILDAVDEDVVTKALGRPVRWKVPDDEDAAREMQHGETGKSETRILRTFLEIASSITGNPVPQRKRKGFDLKSLTKNTGENNSSGDDAPPSLTIAPRKPRELHVYSRRAPNIKWPAPSPIRCGDRLTDAQLNATASVPGTFEYNPGLGELLPAGTHTLSAVFMPADSEKHGIAQATVSLEVATATSTIDWSNPAPIICGTPLGRMQLNATASVPGIFDYSPAAGEVLATGTHTLSVTFTPIDTGSYTSAEATVSIDVTKAMPVIDWPIPQSIECGTALSTAELCATASIPGTFDYSPAEGEVLAAGLHTIAAFFTPTDIENYAATRTTISLEVTRVTPTIDWPRPQPIYEGSPLSETQLCAAAPVPGTFRYSPAPGESLAAGTHSLLATFTPADSTKYAPAQATLSLTVLAKEIPVITWPTPAPIHEGTPLSTPQLCATASVPGKFDYSPSQNETLIAGTHSLSVFFTPTDSAKYAPAQATVSLTVEAKEIPVITWPTPEPIREGTPLSEAQLCATAAVPGTFAYSPAKGNKPSVGTQSLSVIFNPSDSTKYAQAQATVSLIVVAKEIPAITWSKPDPIPYGELLDSAQLCATASVPGKFHYSPAQGEKLTAGAHVLSATFTPDDGATYATTEASVSLEVSKVTPTIEWPAPQPIKDDKVLSATQLCATASVPGTFEYSPAAGGTLPAGTHTLFATFTPADGANYAATKADVPLTVEAKAIPVIEWLDPEPITYGAPLGNSQLCATASVPGTFVYSPALGEVLSAGTHTLRATFTPTDTENYATAEAAVSFGVDKVTPLIEWPSPDSISYGTPLDTAQLCADSTVSGTFNYSPAPGDLLSAGSNTLCAVFTPADTVNYATAIASVSLDVTKATPTLNWPSPSSIQYGTGLNSLQLCASASVPGSFVYSPPLGEVLDVGNHTLSVTFKPEDSVNYVAAQSAVPLDVTKATPAIEWQEPETITYGTVLSDRQLCAKGSVRGALAYSHEPGEMFTAGVRTLSVTFTPEDNANYSEAKATVSLVVNRAMPAIEWPATNPIQCGTPLSSTQLCATASVPGTFEYSPAEGTILPAGTHSLSATFSPTDEVNYAPAKAAVPLDVARGTIVISWANPAPIPYGMLLSASQLCATASVPGRFEYSSALGDVLPVGSHTLSVTVTPTDTASYATTKATATLEVVKSTPAIDWPTPKPITCDSLLGAKQLCAATSVPGSFEYTPRSGESLSAGTHSLTATFTPLDRTSYETAKVTVLLEVTKVSPSIDWSTPRPITYGTALGVSQLNAAAWVPGTFAYSPGLGEVLPEGTHTLSVTFTPKDCASYAVVKSTVFLNVIERPKPVITWTRPFPISYGTRLSSTQLGATASIPGTFEFSPAAGEMLPVGTHELSVAFTPNATLNYEKARVTVSLQVVPATPAITWSNPKSIRFGTTLGSTQLCAIASVPGTFNYSPAPGTELKAGKHTISATFTPTDSTNYAPTNASVSIEVTRATPKIEWAAPKPIRFGARLDSAQLCSTASVPGTFYYSPSLGELLSVGLHTLSVSFTPSDTDQYENAQTTVVLNVRKPFRWGRVFAALITCMILLALVLILPSLINYGKDAKPDQQVPPSPAVTETQPPAGKPKASSRAKAPQAKPANKAGKNNPQNAPTPIPPDAKDHMAGNAAPASKTDSVSQALDWISLRIYEMVDSIVQFFERQTESIRGFGK